MSGRVGIWNIIGEEDVVEIYNNKASCIYNPSVRYLSEIEDPENPLRKIRRGMYHLDRINYIAPVTPAEYNQIRNLLAEASMADQDTGLGLYIGCDIGEEYKMFPISKILNLPEMSEDVVSYPDFIEVEFESRYTNEMFGYFFPSYGESCYGEYLYGE